MVPEGWKIKSLQEIATISSGGTPSRSKPSYWENGTIPWVTTAEVNYQTIIDTEQKITKEGLDNSSAKLYPKDTILMAMYGQGKTRGQVAKLGIEASTNQACAAIQLKDNFNAGFYYQLLVSQYKRIRHLANSGGQKNLSSTIIKEILVPTPPLPEQQKIAKILTTWDKAIDTTERLIDNSKQQKKALMQQLLTGKKRLLDDEGKRFEGEWLTKKLVDITTRIQRKSDGNDHPILTISSLSGFMTQKERYSRFMAGESLKKYVLLKNGEFAYNKGNSKTYQFGCIFKLEDFETGLVPNIYVCFKINNGLCEDFYKYLFEADYLKPQLGRLVNTGVRNDGLLNIRPDEFLNTTVPVPPIDEQQKIAAVLTNASREIELLEQQLADLQQEKKALMQQLLTGKKRVVVDG
ncbi:restriction endonuclease subunit S [Psychrobacter sp. A3]|uniref:restriction endonuclease subunit S n=1 Tax=Psychrobacter sp. A3 TaxID=2992754 RepID=UPI00237C22DE|nr:restriction endonuclease subunit S [Psychrobacter sp. A3]MDE0490032.1 restriction endonuclease subunit S [Psychrobacter sp. A3]